MPKSVTEAYMPADFKKIFPFSRVVIDGTEAPFEKPSDVQEHSAMWSSYKNGNTLKLMVGISPHEDMQEFIVQDLFCFK